MSLTMLEAELYWGKMEKFVMSKDGLVHTAILQGSDEFTKILILGGVFPQVDRLGDFGLFTDDSLPVTPAVYAAIYRTIMGARILSEQTPVSVDDPTLRKESERYQAALGMPSIVLGIGRGRTESINTMKLYTAPGISPFAGLAEIKYHTSESRIVRRLPDTNLSA